MLCAVISLLLTPYGFKVLYHQHHIHIICGFFLLSLFCIIAASVKADDDVDVDGTVEEDLGKSRDGSRTDDEVVQRSVWT